MKRKKWTPATDVNPDVISLRDKKKWQLAFRRYVIEKMAVPHYAPYFGLSVEGIRDWIAVQFESDINWDNFGTAWQFEHILPLAFFDLNSESDLRICWNFINIKVKSFQAQDTQKLTTPLGAKRYFELMYQASGYPVCKTLLDKIQILEDKDQVLPASIGQVLKTYSADLLQINSLSKEDFNRLNSGTTLHDIVLEQKMLWKFG